MVNNILDTAGIKYRKTRFPQPPAEAYAVYMDDVTADGPDGINAIFTHGYTVELYTHNPEEADTAEANVEEALNAAGMAWSKQDRYWLQTEQLYQTIYEFTHTEKRRIE